MIKPKKIKRGDTVAIVSLSSGIAGDKEFRHRYEQGKKRLEEVFKLKTVTMPNALKEVSIYQNIPKQEPKISWML